MENLKTVNTHNGDSKDLAKNC